MDNKSWLKKKMKEQQWTQRDLLVVAGDISHEMDILEDSIECMREKCQIFFVCGNHEAWLRKHDKFDSLEKMENVYELCRRRGVFVDPCLVKGNNPLLILPIQSWYDGSLCFSEQLCTNFEYWPWVDFLRCRWNGFSFEDERNPRTPTGLVEHLLEKNEARLQLLSQYSSTPVMTVSHFLPNKQTLPDWLELKKDSFSLDWLDHGARKMSAKFSKVAGSSLIDDHLRSLPVQSRHIHIFGHSHRPKDFEYGGIRYIHNPLGKPRERQMHMISPDVDFQFVWDSRYGEQAGEQVLRYWEEKGGGKEALWKRLEQNKPGRYQKQ
jgi:predicted phosphodiesterase